MYMLNKRSAFQRQAQVDYVQKNEKRCITLYQKKAGI